MRARSLFIAVALPVSAALAGTHRRHAGLRVDGDGGAGHPRRRAAPGLSLRWRLHARGAAVCVSPSRERVNPPQQKRKASQTAGRLHLHAHRTCRRAWLSFRWSGHGPPAVHDGRQRLRNPPHSRVARRNRRHLTALQSKPHERFEARLNSPSPLRSGGEGRGEGAPAACAGTNSKSLDPQPRRPSHPGASDRSCGGTLHPRRPPTRHDTPPTHAALIPHGRWRKRKSRGGAPIPSAAHPFLRASA
jgi:hypothetical protein